jgi:hypothetical protein
VSCVRVCVCVCVEEHTHGAHLHIYPGPDKCTCGVCRLCSYIEDEGSARLRTNLCVLRIHGRSPPGRRSCVRIRISECVRVCAYVRLRHSCIELIFVIYAQTREGEETEGAGRQRWFCDTRYVSCLYMYGHDWFDIWGFKAGCGMVNGSEYGMAN